MKKIATVILCAVISLQVQSQEENAKGTTGKSVNYSMFWTGIETSTVSYFNNDTKDSSGVQVYLAPYINYNHKSGFGMKLKSYSVPFGSDPGFYMTSVSPYFARYDGKFYPFISYTRYIQHDNPSVPYSPIQNELYAHLRFRTNIVDPWIGIDYGFGKDEQNNDEAASDINTFIGLSHLFILYEPLKIGNSSLGIRPLFVMNAGTDRYFKYLKTTKYISRNPNGSNMGYGKGSGSAPSGNGNGNGNRYQPQEGSASIEESYTINEDNSFAISNLEANLSLMFFVGQFSIEPSGSVYFPMRGDDRSAYGYWQINLNYWFK
jgi:hypothetical protein